MTVVRPARQICRGSAWSLDLDNARQQCHHAVQLNTRFARGFIAAKEDDSHTSLVWLAIPGTCNAGKLAGQWADSPSGRVRLALSVANLAFEILDASSTLIAAFPLDGHTFEEARSWLAEHLTARGLDPGPLSAPLHFQLADHPLAHGARFALTGAEAEFDALAHHYATAAELFEERRAAEPRAAAVWCWPHHFDIATLITLSGNCAQPRTIGVGLSPGDQSFAEPYYYVSPWPYPEPARLPVLKSGGSWNVLGWTGAVMLARSLPKESIRAFLDEAVGVVQAL